MEAGPLERICTQPGCNTPVPDDGAQCPNCGEFVDLPDMDYEMPARETAEESPKNGSKKKRERSTKKLTKKDQELIDRILGRKEDANLIQLFR